MCVVHMCVRACVRACVRVRACVCVRVVGSLGCFATLCGKEGLVHSDSAGKITAWRRGCRYLTDEGVMLAVVFSDRLVRGALAREVLHVRPPVKALGLQQVHDVGLPAGGTAAPEAQVAIRRGPGRQELLYVLLW